MEISWFTKKEREGIATFYDTNITLNKTASDQLGNAYAALIGIHEKEKYVAIKPLSKEVATRGDIDPDSICKISVKSTYSRISNTEFVRKVAKIISEDFSTNPKKFLTSWDAKQGILIIHTNRKGE